jgi:hypothetical protein
MCIICLLLKKKYSTAVTQHQILLAPWPLGTGLRPPHPSPTSDLNAW